jgi:capsular exopolysaccharide synthesis family protein
VVETSNRLKQVDAAIQNEITKQTGRIKSDYEAAAGRERMLQAALEQQKQEATKLNESAIEYSILKREADTNRQLYDGLLQKLKEAGVTAGLQASNIRVVDAARVPLAPSKPDIPRNLGIALLLGLTGGVALAFVLEVLDNTVRTPEQVEAIAALPSLGIVPLTAGAHQASLLAKKTRGLLTTKQVRPNGAVGLVAYSRPKSGIAESFRALRTSILLSSMGSPPKTIVVTSALPREGKTTTSVNSAVVLAQKGGKVLLVDADMRRPGVHQVMGLSARSGLSTVLTGSDSYANAILQSRQLNNLFVLPAGPTPPHPAELLGSPAMKKLLEQWSAVYDHIVIDTPPILSVTDPVVLSVEVDAVVLVIRSGQTSKDALRRARDLLTQVNARVMGVVVNAVDLQSPDLSYHYYYGSKYGGSYYEDGVARN